MPQISANIYSIKKRSALKNIIIVAVLALLTNCTESKTGKTAMPDFPMFDTWRADKMACKGDRQKLDSTLNYIRPQLLGTSEEDIRGLLGQPDAKDITGRSQTFWVYYVAPGSQCNTKDSLKINGRQLRVRFNSLNVVCETSYTSY